MVRHIEVNITIGCNQYITAYCYFTHNNGICSYPDIVSDSWRYCSFTSIFLPDCNTRCNVDILSQNSLRIYHNRTEMTEVKPLAYFGFFRYLYKCSVL